jgi:hypothetical protein
MRIDIKGTPQEKVKAAAFGAPDLAALLTMTPAQIDAWVDANGVSLVQLRQIIKLLVKLAIVQAADAKR